MHDNAVNYFVLFDQFEWQAAATAAARTLGHQGLGRHGPRSPLVSHRGRRRGRPRSTRRRRTCSTAARSRAGGTSSAGVRQDFRPGPRADLGGLRRAGPGAVLVRSRGHRLRRRLRAHALRFETEYELLLTNRLVLQPLVEVEIFGKSDPERGIGAGLSSADLGLRLRYEFRREFAPYVGVVWNRKFFGTADYARGAGDAVGGVRLASGVRLGCR